MGVACAWCGGPPILGLYTFGDPRCYSACVSCRDLFSGELLMPPPNPLATAIVGQIVSEPAKASLAQRIAEAAIDLEEIRALPYNTPADEADAAEIMHAIRAALAEVEEERTKITGPLNAAKRAVDALFKPLSSKLEESEKTIKAALVAAQDRREAMNAAAKAQALALAQRGAPTAHVAATLALVRDESPPPGIYFREVWAFEVESLAEVPRSFVTVDADKVKAFADACEVSGMDPAIEGIRFFRKKIPVAAPR